MKRALGLHVCEGDRNLKKRRFRPFRRETRALTRFRKKGKNLAGRRRKNDSVGVGKKKTADHLRGEKESGYRQNTKKGIRLLKSRGGNVRARERKEEG